jgi:hypothetical protein
VTRTFQCGLALAVAQRRIGPFAKEQLHDIGVSAFGGGNERGVDKIDPQEFGDAPRSSSTRTWLMFPRAAAEAMGSLRKYCWRTEYAVKKRSKTKGKRARNNSGRRYLSTSGKTNSRMRRGHCTNMAASSTTRITPRRKTQRMKGTYSGAIRIAPAA